MTPNLHNKKIMSKINVGTAELLSYSTILENIISTNLQVMSEMSRAVSEDFSTKEEIEPMYLTCVNCLAEAQEKYKEVQVELDYRMKKDLSMKLGIRKTQECITKFDTFVKRKQDEVANDFNDDLAAAEKISKETLRIVGKDKGAPSSDPKKKK